VTANRAFLLAIPFVLAVEAGIFYGLAALGANGQLAVETGIFYALVALGANGQTVVTAEMVWLCVAVVLCCLFVGHFEDEETDGRGD